MKNILPSPHTKLNFAARLLSGSWMSFRQKHFKKLLHRCNLLQTVIFCLLFILGGLSNGYGQCVQNTFDGCYYPVIGALNDEYFGAFTQEVDLNASGTTCKIERIWAKIVKDESETPIAFQLGLKIGNPGSALFRIYVDADNDPTSGLLLDTDLKDPLPVAGAEFIFEIDAGSGATTVYDENLDPISSLISGLNGDFSGSDGRFIEVNIPFTSINYSPCNSSGIINIAQFVSVKGGNISSDLCSSGTLSFQVGVGGEVSPDREVCPGGTSGELTLSSYTGTVVGWQYAVSPFSTWIDITNLLTTYTSGLLYETTQFRAVVEVPGCAGTDLYSQPATITVLLPPDVTPTSQSNVSCFGVATGVINTTTTGGTTPYIFAWTASLGGIISAGQEDDEDLSLLVAGTYDLLVTDAKGCTDALQVIITQPEAALTATVSADNLICNEGTTTLEVTASGGTSPYQYSLDNSVFQSSNEFTVTSGTYTIYVKDANGCTYIIPSYTIQNACITVVKTGTYVDNAPTGIYNAGDQITYAFIVTNTGNVTLTNVTVTDPKVTVSGGPIAAMLPGAVDISTFAATYTLLQADIDAGTFTNTATATGTFNSTPYTDTDDDIQNFVKNASYSLTKTQDKTTYATLGEKISYEIVVLNTGNVTLTNVLLSDGNATITSVNNPIATLAPGASVTVTAEHIVTQSDLNTGSISNFATGTGKDPQNQDVLSTSNTVTATVVKNASYSLTKTQDKTTYATLGEKISYEIVVLNTGNVTLTNVLLSDGNATITSVNNPIATLAPGASVTVTAEHIVTQSDLNTGSISNFATGTGKDPQNQDVLSTSNTVTATVVKNASYSLTKTQDKTTYATLGEKISYEIVVLNTGNVTLTNVLLSDGNATITSVNNPIATLAPGASVTVTAEHIVTQSDLNTGSISNFATGTGKDPQNQDVLSTSNTVTATVVKNASYSLTKTQDKTTYATLGEKISYEIVVLNTGNVTLTNVLLSDGNATITSVNNPIATLAPGASVTVTAEHIVTQSDLNTGSISNFATGTGKDPQNQDVLSTSNTVTATVVKNASYSLTKTQDKTTYATLGEKISYEIVVLNTGNVTLTNVLLSDGNATITSVNNPIATLAPGASVTVTAEHIVTQSDLNTGSISNFATGTGKDPQNQDVLSTSNTVTATVVKNASYSLTKTQDKTTYATLGEKISYEIVVLNTGNVTLTNVLLSDGNATITSVNNPIATLAPGASVTVTAEHIVTQSDLNTGSISNFATGTGKDPQNQDVLSTSNTVTATVVKNASYSLTKTQDKTTYATLGEKISYEIVVLNTGNVTLTNVLLSDGNATITSVNNPIATLAPGASVTVTAEHIVTQSDLNTGSISNFATGTGKDPQNQDVLSTSNTVTATVVKNASYSLTKTQDKTTYATLGEKISYEIVVLNTGNVTLTNVLLSDGNATITSVNNPIATLAPGASVTVTAEHIVTQSDLNTGSISNFATGTGKDPQNQDVLSTSNTVTATVVKNASYSLTKTQDKTTYATLGEKISYEIVVLNTGNVTLTNVLLSDGNATITSVNNPIATLAPGASVTVTAEHIVTQSDLNTGSISNFATGTGKDPQNQDVLSTSNTVTATVVKNASYSLTKTQDKTTYATLGEKISYEIVVLNTGNVTLTNVLLSDGNATITSVNNPIATLAPGASVTVTAEHIVTQSDLNTGSISNFATGTGKDPQNQDVLSTSNTVTATVVKNASYSLTKTQDKTTYATLGEKISYEIVVLNTGNVTLTNVLLSDGNATITSVNNPIATLAPGASVTVTAEHIVTQSDLNTGSISNFATGTGKDPQNQDVLSTSNTVTATVVKNASYSLTKTQDKTTYATLGEKISYEIVVLNTGNVTLTNVLLSDGNATITSVNNPIATLAPGASVTVTAEHIVTQSDLNTGSISNFATGTGKDPQNQDVLSTSNTVTATVVKNASYSLTKTQDKTTYATLGEKISYEIVVLNTGNVTRIRMFYRPATQ